MEKNVYVTLGFPVRENKVWLALKKKKLCAGKLNGYGGGLKSGEEAYKCMEREFNEESTAVALPNYIIPMGIIGFLAGKSVGASKLICICHIFVISDWTGNLSETDEMSTPEPFPINNLPFDRMMPSDRLWLSNVLCEGMSVNGQVFMSEDMSRVLYNTLSFVKR